MIQLEGDIDSRRDVINQVMTSQRSRETQPRARGADSVHEEVPTGWIEQSCHGDQWTVGALVSEYYESVLRVSPPTPSRCWWSAYRDVYEVVGSVGERHTSTLDRALFAIWEGVEPLSGPDLGRSAFGRGQQRDTFADAVVVDGGRWRGGRKERWL